MSNSYTENNSFARPFRLKSRDALNHVFERGRKVKSWPVVLHYAETKLSEPVPCQAAVSVSKRRFKRAVDRNRIKRLMREAWRLEKVALEKSLHGQEKQLAIVFIYVGNKLPTFQTIQTCVRETVEKIPYRSDFPENE